MRLRSSETAGRGRSSVTSPPRCRASRFLAAGLPVALGQDDIEDAYYPFGRHSMLKVTFLAAHLLGMLSGPDQQRLLKLVTTRAADVVGLAPYGIAVGNPADLCVHDAERVVDVLREHAPPRWVVRAGRVVAETEATTRFAAPVE